MKTIDMSEIDFEKLFNEWSDYLKQNKSDSFLYESFKYWISVEKKYFKGLYHVKGSNHGQKHGDEQLGMLIRNILGIWESIGLVKASDNHHNRRWWSSSPPNCYDLVY